MSMINEQIKGLRKLTKTLEDGGLSVDILQLINELRCSADTIEELSAKLASANMERSTVYYNDGWIPCSERLPECEMLCFVTYEWLDGSIHVAKDIYTDGGEWFETKFDSVLAWMPINEPAPYQPKGE